MPVEAHEAYLAAVRAGETMLRPPAKRIIRQSTVGSLGYRKGGDTKLTGDNFGMLEVHAVLGLMDLPFSYNQLAPLMNLLSAKWAYLKATRLDPDSVDGRQIHIPDDSYTHTLEDVLRELRMYQLNQAAHALPKILPANKTEDVKILNI